MGALGSGPKSDTNSLSPSTSHVISLDLGPLSPGVAQRSAGVSRALTSPGASPRRSHKSRELGASPPPMASVRAVLPPAALGDPAPVRLRAGRSMSRLPAFLTPQPCRFKSWTGSDFHLLLWAHPSQQETKGSSPGDAIQAEHPETLFFLQTFLISVVSRCQSTPQQLVRGGTDTESLFQNDHRCPCSHSGGTRAGLMPPPQEGHPHSLCTAAGHQVQSLSQHSLTPLGLTSADPSQNDEPLK